MAVGEVLGAPREAHGGAVHDRFRLTAGQAQVVLRTGWETRPNFAKYSYCKSENKSDGYG